MVINWERTTVKVKYISQTHKPSPIILRKCPPHNMPRCMLSGRAESFNIILLLTLHSHFKIAVLQVTIMRHYDFWFLFSCVNSLELLILWPYALEVHCRFSTCWI